MSALGNARAPSVSTSPPTWSPWLWLMKMSVTSPGPTPARGLVATLNEGLTLSDAPFVARIDADDVMLQTRRLAEEVLPAVHGS